MTDKDYHVEIKVRNNLLYQAMLDEGFETASALSRVSGASVTNIGNALNLKTPLYSNNGDIRKIWLDLSETLRRLPEDLVPENHHYDALKKNVTTTTASLEEMANLTYLKPPESPEQLMFDKQREEFIRDELLKLTPREERVLRLTYGIGCEPHTLEAAAEEIGVTRERVRQIQNKGLRKLKGRQARLDSRDYAYDKGKRKHKGFVFYD